MPELEILEAHVPVRTPRLVREEEPATARLSPIATWFSGPVFSRARDIFAANMTELLDRSEDPAKMIRMIIIEMEETLVEVRASAARSIADIKEMRRTIGRLDEIQSDWTGKAELALSKDREDLAKLQAKLREARARQNAIAARLESAVARAKAREIMHGTRTEEAFSKFEILERRADFAEGRAEALGMTSLEDEIHELKASESIDRELAEMKAALAARAQ